jgi:hypothetical protein
MNKYYEDTLKIKNIIQNNNIFFIGRVPAIEVNAVYQFNKFNTVNDFSLNALENNAGIKVINKESLKKYTEEYLNAYKICTGICIWDGPMYDTNKLGQDYICEETPTIPKINAIGLEPYYFRDSWMDIIENKRVLIIHPFVEIFKKQSMQLEKIFPNRKWFRGCTFSFIKPPITLAGNHNETDWQIHIQGLKDDISANQEFDMALVACGGYGMLISAYIYKELNKSVMYIGGALQLFFGVIGKRWFTNKDILELMNDDWVRPQKQDKPQNFNKVENGCYW